MNFIGDFMLIQYCMIHMYDAYTVYRKYGWRYGLRLNDGADLRLSLASVLVSDVIYLGRLTMVKLIT